MNLNPWVHHMAIMVEHSNIRHVSASVDSQTPVQFDRRIVSITRSCNAYIASINLSKSISVWFSN